MAKRFFAVIPSVILICVGVFFIIIGCILLPVFHAILLKEFKELIPLTPGSQTVDPWEKPADNSDMYLKFRMFNLLNPNAVLNGSKPILKEMGPYTYKEIKVKKAVIFEHNDTVSYKEIRTMIFDPSQSAGSQNDSFFTVNAPLMAVVTLLQAYPMLEDLLDLAMIVKFIKEEAVFKNLTVYDILWGYKDDLLTKVSVLVKKAGFVPPPGFPLDGYFGFFHKKNNTDDGYYSINSGQTDLNQFMQIQSWNFNSHVNYWKTEKCNRVVGTDGTMYHPFVKKTEGLSLFSSDLCRSLTLHYKNDEKFKGVSLRRYGPSADLFAYPPTNPDNACYCVGPHCPRAGVLNISACQSGAPVFVSQPHFLEGPYYQSLVVGMKPNASVHETFIDIEPNTGIVMRGAKRLQLNIDISNNSRIMGMEKLPSLLFPLVWLEESGTINDHGMGLFKQQFQTLDDVMLFLAYFLPFLGILMVLCTLLYIGCSYKKHKRQQYEASLPPTEKSALLVQRQEEAAQDNDWSDMVRS